MLIQNVSYSDIVRGDHLVSGSNCVLIQIIDYGLEFPIPKKEFAEIFQFNFQDIEDTDKDKEMFEIAGMKPEQAKEIVAILKKALENHMDVVVHCYAGICRSGAVAEVGVEMGFIDTNTYRQPNIWVKNLLRNELGWSYKNEQE